MNTSCFILYLLPPIHANQICASSFVSLKALGQMRHKAYTQEMYSIMWTGSTIISVRVG